MKIVVCGSMTFSPEMIDVGKRLESLGHEVTIPAFAEAYADLQSNDEISRESSQNKIHHDLIRAYYTKIKAGDGILVYNQTKKGIDHYIGANTFLEMGFAHVERKPIFLYFPIPAMPYLDDEIIAMRPTVINGVLERMVLSTLQLSNDERLALATDLLKGVVKFSEGYAGKPVDGMI